MKEKMVVKMGTVGLLPKVFAAVVKDAKLAILLSRARAAQSSNVLCHYCYANENNAAAAANWKRRLACPHVETITGK